MSHGLAGEDRSFRLQFEAGAYPADRFDHRAHLRLAYVYLVDSDADTACAQMRDALHAFLRRNAVDPAKYHDTITKAWILAVRHFMEKTPSCRSADAFIDANPSLLDSRIMMSHYSADLLFSAAARADFVEPDREPIPRYPD